MSTFTPVVPTSPPQSNSAPAPAALTLEARFRASQYNRAESLYDLASRLNVSDTSKLNIDSIPAQFNVNSRLSGLPSESSKLNIDSIPAKFNVTSRLSGLPSQSSKLNIDSIPSRYSP